MTPERFRACFDLPRDQMGVSSFGLAAALQLDERLVRRFYSGKATVPADVADWLERAVTFHQANPPPVPPHRRQETGTPTRPEACPE